jgi:ATP-dependent Clp endopeptidase proteolytic subunit ClpP
MLEDIFIYSHIGDGGITAEYIRKQLAKTGKDVTVHINSGGGDVYEGYTIYNLFKSSGKNITMVVEGLCASIATLIVCAGNKIIMNPTSQFIIHNPFTKVEGDAELLRKVANELDKIKSTIIQAYKIRTGKTEEELWLLMNNETSFSASETKDFGFADEVSQTLKAVAYIDISKLKTEKTMEQKFLDAFNNLSAKIEAVLKIKPKNLSATLADGTEVFIETESESELQGKAIFIVTSEGQQPAPDGDYTLANGTVVSVKGGVIIAVTMPEANKATEEVENLKKEIENLKTQLADKDKALQNKTAEAESVKAESEKVMNQLKEFKNEFDKIRNTVVGGDTPPLKKPQTVIEQRKQGQGLFDFWAKEINKAYN